ncbi:MAG: 2,3-bisphosphoglycerate-independent phosphoglycerate mutase [Clostridia bacterium]|nr:2,3-bisphosphoglycerate-independent phosphoglycerate mutase [Clostridia bacterium]
MKYVMIIGDGMADMPIAEIGNKTPLEYLAPRSFAEIASGKLGRLRSCPPEFSPGSDVAFLTLLGNDTSKVFTGRSPLEAAGMGVKLKKGEVCFRLNLAAVSEEGFPGGIMLSHNGGGIEGDEAFGIITSLINDGGFSQVMKKYGLVVYPTNTFRHAAVLVCDDAGFILAPPHDIVGRRIEDFLPDGTMKQAIFEIEKASFESLNHHPINESRRKRGLLPANCAWLWGAGTVCTLENFADKYAVKGLVISAVPLVKGIARLGGLDAPDYPWATGLLDTDYEKKAQTAIEGLKNGYDFALIHLEAPDEMSHDGSLENKLESIRRLDERIVGPVLDELKALGDHRVLLMPDHYTLLSTRTHDATPVPFALYDSREGKNAQSRPFTEKACENEKVLETGDELMRLFFEKGG